MFGGLCGDVAVLIYEYSVRCVNFVALSECTIYTFTQNAAR